MNQIDRNCTSSLGYLILISSADIYRCPVPFAGERNVVSLFSFPHERVTKNERAGKKEE